MCHRLLDDFDRILGGRGIARIGVAVSGGSDSLALLHLTQKWAASNNTRVFAATVDHGLRAAAPQEAAEVAKVCATLGVAHETLQWRNWDRQGNLQQEARRARYGLLADWAQAHDLDTVALGHTVDDQAETVLMRLARGAGSAGLAGMQPHSTRGGVNWVRPLLTKKRSDLRRYLTAGGIEWIDDPSNDDDNFDRIKMRRGLAHLHDLGISTWSLSQVAQNMTGVEEALTVQTDAALIDHARVEAGALVLPAGPFAHLPDEIQRRVLLRAITWIAPREHPPRRGAVSAALAQIATRRDATVGGCHVHWYRSEIWVFREYKAVQNLVGAANTLWDGRWQFGGPDAAALIAPLGEAALHDMPQWRGTGRPRPVLISAPAVWRDGHLVAAPFAGMPNDWYGNCVLGRDLVIDRLLSH